MPSTGRARKATDGLPVSLGKMSVPEQRKPAAASSCFRARVGIAEVTFVTSRDAVRSPPVSTELLRFHYLRVRGESRLLNSACAGVIAPEMSQASGWLVALPHSSVLFPGCSLEVVDTLFPECVEA